MTTDELIQERPWFTRPVGLPHEPAGMLGKRESMLCYYLAKEAFTGRGTIVDAGSFLGRSAYHFAQGLRANPRYVVGRNRIHCFDNFLVNEIGTVQFILNDLKETASLGDSTREIFDAQVAPVRDMLEIHAGDFNTVEWQREPIEILMVDIAKSESLSKQVVKVFFPDLIPGESLVIQQDYHHPWLPHIHVVMEYLADYFELVVPRVDDSAVFLYRKEIPADVLHHAATHDFTSEEQVELMDRAISRLPEEDRYYVQLARIVLRSREVDGAILHSELDELEQRFLHRARDYNENTYFTDVRDHIDEWEGWRQIKARNFRRALELADGVVLRRRNTHLLRLRGCALAGLGRHSEAEQEFRAALKMDRSSGVATIELARAIRHQDRLEEAEAEVLGGLRDRIATDATSREYLSLLEEIWQLKNDPQHEAVVLADLKREMPDDPEVEALAARMRQHRTGQVSTQEKPWQSLSLPAAVTEKRSMLSQEEKQYLTWLTAEKFEGWGAIVELGCWLGSSSIALAEGLRRRDSTAKIHSFDRFVWEPYMDRPAGESLNDGDDFLPLYLREIGDYAPWIQAQKVDLLNYSWTVDPSRYCLWIRPSRGI
jgi:predicted O-methyltransferase YrrM